MSVKTCESLACVAGAGLLHARGTRKGERRQLSLIYSPPFSLSRSLVVEISLFAPKTTGACYAGLANLNPLKCINSASGKISPTGFVQVMENLDSRGILWISFSRFGKSWNLIVSLWKSWKIIVLFGRLVTTDDKGRWRKIKRRN